MCYLIFTHGYFLADINKNKCPQFNFNNIALHAPKLRDSTVERRIQAKADRFRVPFATVSWRSARL